MSTLAVILIVVGAVLLLLLLGGYAVMRRRVRDEDIGSKIAEADRALEQARAADRGWDRVVLEQACQAALRSERPDVAYEAVQLVLVDDRPGVTDDRAHLVATGPGGSARVVLGRREGGDWTVERVE
jgi:hypothetical protein